ncbi:hypothetical protein BD410DRAFT_845607 [Rickenella mellea]|uniref:Uncharacterized protein n=1 Tax=Rickenella mellea TaxID=50990 RepID=A0A4Y7PIP0_9AGAM|nr:hypothetical protein BD410DRAFT_845607 [Rickenella mellea]
MSRNHGLRPPLSAGRVRVRQTKDTREHGHASALESMAVLPVAGEALVSTLAKVLQNHDHAKGRRYEGIKARGDGKKWDEREEATDS